MTTSMCQRCSNPVFWFARHSVWLRVRTLNLRHKEWAWISLATVGLADLYIRLAASGVFHDPRIL